MIPESSPFSPGPLASAESFVGRLPEIERLRGMINASTQGRFRIGFVSGERGIGKSSLAAERDMQALERDFVSSMRRLLNSFQEHPKAIFLILDDINGLAGSAGFANWLKSTVDETATSGDELRLCILVVGLEERRRELVEKQPSLARVFELIDIAPWSDDEVRQFYRESFGASGAGISEAGLELLARPTGGLPVLAHEIGDAAWRTARGPDIGAREVLKGIFMAAEVIGRKLLNPQVFDAIRSERYHSIFRKMADLSRPGTRFRRAELADLLTDAESKSLDNFLRRMTTLGALERDPETRGAYRFPNLLHALYFRMESQRRQREERA